MTQVTDNFDRQDFNKMCWTLCSRKNLDQSKLFISNDDAFKIWCIFNFLSEDRYPLMIVTEEVSVKEGGGVYILLKKYLLNLELES